LKDSVNPKFLYSTTDTELLVRIINSSIDPVELAKNELMNRGCDPLGFWVGFVKSRAKFKALKKAASKPVVKKP
jgi:hypothetical protein